MSNRSRERQPSAKRSATDENRKAEKCTATVSTGKQTSRLKKRKSRGNTREQITRALLFLNVW